MSGHRSARTVPGIRARIDASLRYIFPALVILRLWHGIEYPSDHPSSYEYYDDVHIRSDTLPFIDVLMISL